MSSRFRCSLCSEVYKSPKLLPCFHSFCQHCLYDHIGKTTKNEHFLCPTCKAEVMVPNNIAEEFRTNHYIVADIEQHLDKDVELGGEDCEICKSKQVVEYSCNECEQRMCSNCYSVHSSMKTTKDHSVKKLQISSHSIIIDRRCQEHNEELHFYCRTCGEGVCVHCKVENHATHATEHTDDVREDGRRKLKKLSSEWQRHVQDLRCELDALAYRKRLIEKSCEETCKFINEQAEIICNHVFIVRNEKLQEASDFRELQIQNILTVENEIKVWENQMTTMADYVKMVSMSSSDVGVLETCDLLRDKVQITADYDCPSVDVECMEFEAEENTKSSVQNMFGRINTYPTLRMRLSFGPVNYFECGSDQDVANVICPVGNGTAWVASHAVSERKSSISLFDSKGEMLKLISCDEIVKCFALLDKNLHVLTSESFYKLNKEQTDLEYLVGSSLPLHIASNATSMFYLARDHSCHYVTNTDVKPVATTRLCLIDGLRHPLKMAVDNNEHLVIIDSVLQSIGVFDFNGVMQSKYSIQYDNFVPIDVCSDNWGDLLIVDDGNKAIHELAADGNGSEIMYSRFSGLKNVCCIAADEDTWWFGSSDGKMFVKYFR